MEFFSSLGINILSSIVYDIGKAFVNNKNKPLSEKQILDIIGSFQHDFDDIFNNFVNLENQMLCIQKQNEIILKLLLLVFNSHSNISFVNNDDGYLLLGNYSLNTLSNSANNHLSCYADSLPNTPPETLGEAIWPIPNELKGVLLDEIEENLYE